MTRLSYPARVGRLATTLLALTLLLAMLVTPASGAPPITRTLAPVGSGYSESTLQRFALAASQRDTSGTVSILVLPITFSLDAFVTSAKERKDNLALANTRRGQVEAACNIVKTPAQVCVATLAPILVRDDAFLQSNLDLFTADLDGMYILGGDQTVAMRVVADTPTEQRMAAAYNAGAVVGGNSAGAAVESLTMIAGYIGDNGPDQGLQQGSVDLWTSEGPADHERGLIFGLPNAILEQHTYQRGRIGRLLNVVAQTGQPGIGADADTGAIIENEAAIIDVAGATSVIIVDPKTYPTTVRYAGPSNSLAIHGITTHLIPPGGYGYDLTRMRPLVNGQPQFAPDITGRSFDMLRLPNGYGALLLGGDISGDKAGPVAQRFVAQSGGPNARLVIVATGYAKSASAKADAKDYAAALQPGVAAPVQWFVLDARTDQAALQAALAQATGIFVTAPDQSRVLAALQGAPLIISSLRTAWQSGATLMADNAAAAAFGQLTSIDPPPTSASLEDDSMADFRADGVTVHPGLGFVPGVAIEPRMLPDRHWGRLYNILARDRMVLALGVDTGTAVELSQSGGVVWGTSAALTIDGRTADFSLGSNGALAARYVLLDTYVQGDTVTPVP